MEKWKNWGEVLYTEDLSGSSPRMYQKFRSTEFNKILLATRTSFHLWNSPTFTRVKFRLHSVDFRGLPGALIAESNSGGLTPDKISLPYGMVETWWGFDNIRLREDVWYALVPYDPTYVYSENSFLAWRKDYPDPANTIETVVTPYSQAIQAFDKRYITAKL